MMALNFGVGAQTVPVSQVLREFAQEVKTQELEAIRRFIHTEDEKIMQGQPGSIIDLYA